MKAEQLTVDELKAELAKREAQEVKQKEERIKAYNQKRNNYVDGLVTQFKELNTIMVALKKEALETGAEIYTDMFKVHDKTFKGGVKQMTIENEAKTAKIVIAHDERMGFTEEANVAIAEIKQFFKNKFANRSNQVYSLLDALLMKNHKGDYDPKLLSKLRQQVIKINDPKLTEAFELLEKSQTVTDIAAYVRAYTKDEKGKYKDITLQFSAI